MTAILALIALLQSAQPPNPPTALTVNIECVVTVNETCLQVLSGRGRVVPLIAEGAARGVKP